MRASALKNLFFVILSGFLGLMMSPGILMASDSVKITGLDASKIVETVTVEPVVEENMVEDIVEVKKSAPVVSVPKAGAAELASATLAKQTAPANNVKFSWGMQEIFRASSTAVDSGAKVARVGRLIWGHNYTVFGNITKLSVGSTFTVTEGGVATAYRVVANPLDGKAGVVLDKKDSSTLSYAGDARYSSIKMNALTDMGFGGHSLVLMTCYGSNSRYVVVADAI